MSNDKDPRQQKLDTFRIMNRYPDRDADQWSESVFEPPRRTLHNGWRKFHAAQDCGSDSVVYVEQRSHRPIGDRYEYHLVCWSCGHEISEDEVLFVGGDWWRENGWRSYGRPLESLSLPTDRVLDLGPDPDADELKQALNLTRIEQQAGPHVGGPIRSDQWSECEDCDRPVPILFDDRCRMCYDGEWTDRMAESLVAYEQKVRVWHNNSFVHRLEKHVDPTRPGPYPGQILWRRRADGETTKLVEVVQRLVDIDDDDREIRVVDPERTREWTLDEDDVAEQFWDTGIQNELDTDTDERVREVYSRVIDRD